MVVHIWRHTLSRDGDEEMSHQRDVQGWASARATNTLFHISQNSGSVTFTSASSK